MVLGQSKIEELRVDEPIIGDGRGNSYVKCPNCDYVFALVPSVILLTKREVEVATLLAKGLSTREVAESLYVSVKTVESHRQKIYAKLRLHGIARLTHWALKQGLVKL